MKNFIDLSPDETWACVSHHINSELNFNKLSNLINKRSYIACIKKILGYQKYNLNKEN